MRKKKFSRDLFIVSILTLITVITWIALDIYRVFNKNEIPKVLREQIEPLDPNLDIKIFNNLSELSLIHI